MAAHLLGAEGLSLEYPTRVVFESLTLGLEEGDRIGIVGRNGDGKSSLLGMLSGQIEPNAGRVTRRSGVRFGVLDQRDDLDAEETVGRSIVGDGPEHEWARDARVRDVIGGLASDISWESKIGELSGGQRRRVALAALLVGDWDLIALDEPTNHLDVEGVAWLAEHLKRRWAKNAGGLLVITHDRWFLDEVCTETWEVHDGIVEPFEGGYASYVLQRVERDRMAAATEAKRQNLMRKELAWLRRGAPARTSKPKFRIDAANQLIEGVPPVRNPIELQRLAVARLGKDVVDIEDASVSFGDDEVLRDITWRLAPGERTGILGANGAGKSTLLGLICGTLQPTTGRVKVGKTVRIGVLDQQFSQLAEISGDRVREVLARTKTTFTIDGKDHTPAQLLERLGFAREQLSARVDDLSGGQKRRLQLLLLLLSEPNLIALDEPTNDVDSQMLTAMEDLLDSWPGTLIVVSHDRYLLERVTDQQYAILDGRLRHVPGGVDEYLRLRQEQASTPTDRPDLTTATDEHEAASALSGAERRAAQKEISAIERRLERVSGSIETVHRRLAEHDQSDYDGLQRRTDELRELEAEVAQLEERWLELYESVD
ncbi:ABC-F family ATP-binding cassette domain-containing protein [Brevibacterium casei]|uniref:ATPase components of ABC transporters with duplicated ATPase domains n=2 Tax=Brevibacterium casei TaxID=33889 RepID=A0A2H1K5I2_9MICO|nr:ABC-F family ATP-binding cassette domain-containing protein [Brevibacterium casei]MCT1548975.1 ABC-F family ATP-binding cassette domain-containing protein [Brevibacterium casei]MCT1558958.1 ABC-F family ATP-binding cassette domain-containing protein [Brevibacterium casei]MCT2207185.1 ABC-F family ATP-binding cassette domain-containing protein [Brevibacterium casei]QPR38050.1 ABC-F family ATP-binding cassette domain-containing protein [Brevibacterium casei]QPR45339.1 ABC-F family ATP-binding